MDSNLQTSTETRSTQTVPRRRAAQPESVRLSYKFQRLRERLRQAIDAGELVGKLPGERQLARKFRVNAKTLSKALTDLAAEGVLERSIGRGTFVKGADTPAASVPERWLILCDADLMNCPTVRGLLRVNPAAQLASDVASLRPSFLGQFKAAIDCCSQTPEGFLRDLVVRGMTVVLVGREPATYSTHAVLADRTLGATLLARDLMLAGHTRFLAVEPRGQGMVIDAIRKAATRYAPEAVVDHADPVHVVAALDAGVSAIICGTRMLAEQVRRELEHRGIDVPGQVSLATIGTADLEAALPCSGYFVDAAQKVQTVVGLLRDPQAFRPTTLWLTGLYIDRHTTAPRHFAGHDGEMASVMRLNGVRV